MAASKAMLSRAMAAVATNRVATAEALANRVATRCPLVCSRRELGTRTLFNKALRRQRPSSFHVLLLRRPSRRYRFVPHCLHFCTTHSSTALLTSAVLSGSTRRSCPGRLVSRYVAVLSHIRLVLIGVPHPCLYCFPFSSLSVPHTARCGWVCLVSRFALYQNIIACSGPLVCIIYSKPKRQLSPTHRPLKKMRSGVLRLGMGSGTIAFCDPARG